MIEMHGNQRHGGIYRLECLIEDKRSSLFSLKKYFCQNVFFSSKKSKEWDQISSQTSSHGHKTFFPRHQTSGRTN